MNFISMAETCLVVFLFTFAKLRAVIHTLVIVFVLSAEVGIIVVTQRVASVPAVVGN